MKITLLKNYGGSLTGEKRILPGVYDSEDPTLFGLADYLVENGHAVVYEIPYYATEEIPLATFEVDENGHAVLVEDDAKYVKVGEGKTLDLSEEQDQVIKDVLSEAIVQQEETLEEAQSDLAEMLADDPSLSLESEEPLVEAKPKRGRPKKG